MSLQSQLDMQYKEWSFFKDFVEQAMRDIATIQQQEVTERVWKMLRLMMANFAQASRDVTSIQAFPMYAPNEQVSPIPTTVHVPIQHQKQKFIAEMSSYGYQSQKEISDALDLADGDKELAISILDSGILSPTPEPQLQNANQAWDVSPRNESVQDSNGQNTLHNAPLTPINRKRKADSSFSTATPSSAQYAHSPAFSPAPSSVQTPAQTPATPRPTHSPYTPYTPGTFAARRKPSSTARQEQNSLFAVVQTLAPSNKVYRFWGKVTDSLAQVGFRKSEAAWKGEWSRYGTYEHGFDERTGVFVKSEKEKLQLLRCLDNKPKAEVMRAIQELEEEEEEDLIVTGSAKRQKVMGGFGEVEGGVVSADGQSWLAPPDFPPQEFDAGVDYVEEAQTPAVQQSFDGHFSDLFGEEYEQYAEEIENFGSVESPAVKVAINHGDQWLNGAGFDLQDNNLLQNTDEWVFDGTENGAGVDFNVETDLRNNLGDGSDLDIGGGSYSEDENPYLAAICQLNGGLGY